MRTNLLLVLSAMTASTTLASPALAEDLGGGFSVNGGATLVSDYRFRGISQTSKRFAVQGTFTISHETGLYGTLWGSSIDDYVYNRGDQEIGFIAGYRTTFGGTTLDGGVLYYYYPGTENMSSDFFEPYVSVAHTLGPVTAKLSAAYAPKQTALSIGAGKEDNLYLAGDVSAGLPGTPIGVSAHIGHSFGPSYLTIGDEYSDWSFGATYTMKNLVIGVSYVDTDGAFILPTGRNVSKAGVVGSVGVSF